MWTCNSTAAFQSAVQYLKTVSYSEKGYLRDLMNIACKLKSMTLVFMRANHFQKLLMTYETEF